MADPWTDYADLYAGLSRNIVDKLKIIINALNEECATHIAKTGRKQELVDKVHEQLANWKRTENLEKWNKARAILTQVRNTGIYTSPRTTTTMSANGQPSYAGTINIKPSLYAAGSTSIGRYDPYAPPRKPTEMPSTVASSSSSKPAPIRFKPSPFYRVDQLVSGVVECPESTSASDRRQQKLSFTLNEDQLTKLKSSTTTYQLRLFCTSSTFYAPAAAFRLAGPCPIEFPPTCDVRVNTGPLSSNLKGLKKKPGTAPPANLGVHARHSTAVNTLEMVYVNSQQPTQTKKYYLVVMLVEATSVDQLVEKLKKGKHRSGADIQRKMKESYVIDDDIVAGPQKMSLKCPLSFMRINTPCRSSQCTHSQCFDATSWFSVMEQTTTWLCPVCEKTLNPDDLIIDGYFNDILKQSPDSVEDVIVEADGEWHTTDNKYGSAHWKQTHPPVGAIKLPPTPRQSTFIVKSPARTTAVNLKPKPNNTEIFVLDSDDEDEGRVKRELSPSYASGSSPNTASLSSTSIPPRSQTEEVIDLTGSDDEDEPPVTVQAGKRKASSAHIDSDRDSHSKKARNVMTVASLTAIPSAGSSSLTNGHSSTYVLPLQHNAGTTRPIDTHLRPTEPRYHPRQMPHPPMSGASARIGGGMPRLDGWA